MSSTKPLEPPTEEELKKLAELAIDAKEKAYCPYSNFRVGCALLAHSPVTGTSTYHTGANVEVASTPVGICAERCAIAPLIASHKRPHMPVIRAIAVATDINPPASPCGMCRQFIREFAVDGELGVWMYGKDGLGAEGSVEAALKAGKVVKMTIAELLPMSFGPNDMERNKDAGKFGGS